MVMEIYIENEIILSEVVLPWEWILISITKLHANSFPLTQFMVGYQRAVSVLWITNEDDFWSKES